jgi:hypothetical protein
LGEINSKVKAESPKTMFRLVAMVYVWTDPSQLHPNRLESLLVLTEPGFTILWTHDYLPGKGKSVCLTN